MYIRKSVLAFCLSTALVLPHLAQAETLSESVVMALSSHPSIQSGKASKDAAGDAVREQKAAFFPTLSMSGKAGRVHADDDTTRASAGGDAYSWLGEGSATLTQPLFTGFSTTNRLAAAKERHSAAAADLAGTSEGIALKAARAHLNMMRTRELLDMASRNLSEIQTRRDSIELMVREGAADEAELLQAEEALMAARTRRLGYEESFRQAEADYIEATGAVPSGKMEIESGTWNSIIPATVDDAVTQAVKSNPAVLAADGMAVALGKEAAAEKGGILPRVDAELSYLQKDQDDNLGGELMNSQAMLKMSWNFSTGGGQFARVAQGMDRQRVAIARQQEARRAAERDARQKFVSMQIVDQQLALYKERESAAQKILGNFLSQFEGGKQTNLQIIGAEARLFDAKSARTDAFYRSLLARFELLTAMGQLREAFGSLPASPAQTRQDG